ncbi:unnamed protein product [Closterium sp. Naga37s-1]|nr:unnamed protein product [Closterium sp. Naga37s-1]
MLLNSYSALLPPATPLLPCLAALPVPRACVRAEVDYAALVRHGLVGGPSVLLLPDEQPSAAVEWGKWGRGHGREGHAQGQGRGSEAEGEGEEEREKRRRAREESQQLQELASDAGAEVRRDAGMPGGCWHRVTPLTAVLHACPSLALLPPTTCTSTPCPCPHHVPLPMPRPCACYPCARSWWWQAAAARALAHGAAARQLRADLAAEHRERHWQRRQAGSERGRGGAAAMSFSQREKRKRDAGQASRGKNYVEEEKRQLRDQGVYSGFDA